MSGRTSYGWRMDPFHWRVTAKQSNDTDVLDALSFDDDIHVRAAVARNEATTSSALIRLVGDTSRHVVLAALTNRSLPFAVRQMVLEVTSDYALARMTVVHSLPEDRETLRDILNRRRNELVQPADTEGAERARGLIAESKNASTGAYRLDELSREQNVVVRRNVVKHPNVSPSTLESMVSDADRRVRNGVALHPSTKLSTRKILARNEVDPNIVRMVVSRSADREAVAHCAANSVHPGIAAEWQLRNEKDATRPHPKGRDKKLSKCPTPSKTAYAGKAHALGKGAYAARTIGRAIRAYPCPCGSWHHTTQV